LIDANLTLADLGEERNWSKVLTQLKDTFSALPDREPQASADQVFDAEGVGHF
jgi:hypothetical protein